MVLKVRDRSDAKNELSWKYFHTEKLTIREVSREDAKITAFGGEQQSAVQPPFGLEWCLEETYEPIKVNEICIFPKHNEGCGLVFAEFGSIFVMNDDGKTIERI